MRRAAVHFRSSSPSSSRSGAGRSTFRGCRGRITGGSGTVAGAETPGAGRSTLRAAGRGEASRTPQPGQNRAPPGSLVPQFEQNMRIILSAGRSPACRHYTTRGRAAGPDRRNCCFLLSHRCMPTVPPKERPLGEGWGSGGRETLFSLEKGLPSPGICVTPAPALHLRAKIAII